MELTIIQTAISWLSLSVFGVISSFSYQISAVKKYEKLILFVVLDAKFHILKLLFEDFLPKMIRGAGNCESLILRVLNSMGHTVYTIQGIDISLTVQAGYGRKTLYSTCFLSICFSKIVTTNSQAT